MSTYRPTSRWLGAATLAAVAVGLAGAPEAVADPAFGSRFLTGSCCTIYGGRATISQVTLSPSSGSLAVARVEVDDAGGYLVQAGFIRSNNMAWLTCGQIPSRLRFHEALTPAGNFCGGHTNVAEVAASVKRVTGAKPWRAYVDTAQVWAGDAGFATASGMLAGGELTLAAGSMTGTFGSGSGVWQRATAVDAQPSDWFTVGTSLVCDTDDSAVWSCPTNAGTWSVGALPSPFVISNP